MGGGRSLFEDGLKVILVIILVDIAILILSMSFTLSLYYLILVAFIKQGSVLLMDISVLKNTWLSNIFCNLKDFFYFSFHF